MPKAIFTISTGRCGTNYLAKLFSHVPRVFASHELLPNMQGLAMVNWNNGNPDLMRNTVRGRMDQINLLNSNGYVWFGSNNAFIKGYGEEVLNHLRDEDVGVVILTRDRFKIADSILRHGWSVGAERDAIDKSNAWLLYPGLVQNITPDPIGNDPMELALWYVDEVNARADKFVADHPNVTYYRTGIEELNTLAGCNAMFSTFGLEPSPSIMADIGIPTN